MSDIIVKVKDLPFFYWPMADNPLSMDLMLLEEGKLNEGYYRTYPSSTALKYVTQMFGKHILRSETLDKNGATLMWFRIDKDGNSSILDKAMSLCGYHVTIDGRANRKYDNLDYVDIQYAPRYSTHMDDIVSTQEYLYHVSPSNFKEKILKRGLTPRSSNSKFTYPNRIHLFKSFDNESGKNLSIGEIRKYALTLYEEMADIVNPKDERYLDNRETWTLFVIDTSRLPKGIKFYDDTTWSDNMALWTYDNISPSAIVGTNDFFIYG